MAPVQSGEQAVNRIEADALMEPEPKTIAHELLDDLLPPDTSAEGIKRALDEVVVGQESAKLSLSTLLSTHLSAIRQVERNYASPNAFLVGPTGVGKTHTVRTAAEYLGIPFVNVDVTALVPSSSLDGTSIENVLMELLLSAESILVKTNTFAEISVVDMCHRGLVFLDEFDKLRAQGTDEWNVRVQRRLLRLIEGAFSTIRETHGLTLDTSNVLFIASGTFEGVHDAAVVSKRPPHVARILRNPDKVISADLVSYGFLPELIARLPILIDFEPLSAKDLVGILDNPEVDPSRVWREHFRRMERELWIATEAKELIAERAERLNMGARGLQQVLFPLLARLAYQIESSPERKLVLTGPMCEKELTLGW